MKLKNSLLLLCVSPLVMVLVACAQTAATPPASLAQTAAQAAAQNARNYEFIYRADKKLDSVNLAGEFNNWSMTATPMRADADGLIWRARVPLAAGRHFYKFVLNGKTWVFDPATQSETDAQGNLNSLLTLTVDGENSSALSTQSAPGNADKVTILTADKVRDANAPTHEFVYRADKKLDSVSVAGEFNGWNTTATPMHADADGLTWRARVPLNYGSYQYKFVLNGDNWVLDPANARRLTEADGNVNSQLQIAPPDYQTPATPDDGTDDPSALLHEQSVPFLNYDQGRLRFRLRARPDDLRAVALQIGARSLPMKLIEQNDTFAFYQAEIAWDKKTDLSYRFVLTDGARTEFFGANGLDDKATSFRLSAANYRPFVVPNWVEKTVFYQIFPDRFENGDKANDPANLTAWNAAPTGNSRMGGDVAGVEKHLPYLSDLGISGVYFNPVFQSPSNHRYDAQDYRKIDPQFGTNAEFGALTRALQKRGIRTVMDFVFNHSATTFAPFADVRKNGAASPYKDWYLAKSYPLRVQDPPNYLAWGGYAAMPKLNLTNPATANYMLDLVNYWDKEAALSGLRLDVADEVDVRFWRQLRARAKGLDPQLWIVGERWGDAAPWLRGDQWDGAMNYPFLFANVDFFADQKSSASQFTARLMEIYNSYPPQAARAMMNILSSHDRPRFLTVAGDDARLQQLAATVQFTWPGAPSIYYGEELGMKGGADPANRAGMEWDKATPQNAMLGFYKKLIRIRNANPVLQSGAPTILASDDADKTFAYARTLGEQTAIIAVNRSGMEQFVDVPFAGAGRVADALGGQTASVDKGRLKVKLAPLSAAILLATK